MSIASELTEMQTNIEAVYDAIESMGGTLPENRNLASLAIATETIPQGEPEPPTPPTTQYGAALIWPKMIETAAIVDSPEPYNCDPQMVDESVFLEFAAQHPLSRYDLREGYRFSHDSSSDYWQFNSMTDRVQINDSEVEQVLGISVEPTGDWADFTVRSSIAPDTTVAPVWVNVASAAEYAGLAHDNEWEAPGSYTIGGEERNVHSIKAFAFGSANTTTPHLFLFGCDILESVDFAQAASMTSIGDYFMWRAETIDCPLELPETLTAIGDHFMDGAKAFNHKIVIPDSVTSIGENFMSGMSVFDQDFTTPKGITVLPENFMDNLNNYNSTIVVREGVTTINEGAFSHISYRGDISHDDEKRNTVIVLPSTLRTITDAFTEARLDELIFPEGLTTLSASLYGCTCRRVVVPSTVTTCGRNGVLLNGCDYLQELVVNTSVTPTNTTSSVTIGYAAQEGRTCPAYTNGVTLSGTYAAEWKAALPDVAGTTAYKSRRLILAS